MDKIRNGNWNGWIVPLGVLLRLFSVITAQPGFLSISCGGKTNYTAENNIAWVSDAAYIGVGEAADIGDASALGSYLHSLRYFPKPLNRSCYKLPVAPNVPHLVRSWFVLGNFSGLGGCLRDHLHGPIAENSELSWKRRLKIALDAAHGLEYLHVGCAPKIIHRDIKTANILLDSNLNGKLADFGLSRMAIDGEATHITTAVKGTFGYQDPEYFNTQMLTEKSDVYSFGVVLLEIICGRAPIDIKLAEQKVNIVSWVTPYLVEMGENGGEIIEIIDKRLGGSYDMKSMIRVAKVALRCVQAVPSCRPSVVEIVGELKEAVRDEDKDSISNAEDIGIHNEDLMAGSAISNKRQGMECSDNSSNIPNVGR